MSAVVDDFARTRARRAAGLLGTFNAAGLLSAADVHVARTLGRLGGEDDEAVLLAAALTVRSTRAGSVVLDLDTAAATTSPEITGEGRADADGTEAAAGDGAPDVPLPAADPAGLPWPDPAEWRARCAASPLVSAADGPDDDAGGARPLRLDGGSLWLERYWAQERQVARDLLARVDGTRPEVDAGRLAAGLARLFPAGEDADQRLAAAVAVLQRLSVVAGGPGTGKTTTVARLIALLREQAGGDQATSDRPPVRIALAAPTGKAAARLEEAVHAAAARLAPADRELVGTPSASTVHRLLGWRPGGRAQFSYGPTNRLPYDVVIVDETSMVSLTLMASLLAALRPAARLVLVGDPDQLASVEAGAVLGDLVGPDRAPRRSAGFRADLAAVTDHPSLAQGGPPGGTRLRDCLVVLERSRRFDEQGAIAELAACVRDGRAADALALLRAGPAGVEFVEVDDDGPVPDAAVAGVRADVVTAGLALQAAAADGDAAGALDALERHRLLCAHRRGPRGVRAWTDRVTAWLAAAGLASPAARSARPDGRYVGEPLLVTVNDRDAGLFNGDTGVVLAGPDGDLVAAFRRGGAHQTVALGRLPDVRPVHAMTVHRSQGSEFRRVTVLLPAADSPLATRQTLYTALTRASEFVRVVGSAAAVERAVLRPAARASGLAARLRDHGQSSFPVS